MTTDPVRLEVNDRVAEVVLNRPEKLNAIDQDVLEALERCLDQIEADSEARVILVRGEGRAFCAGADLGTVAGKVAEPAVLEAFMVRWHRVFGRLADSPVPSIAAVHGFAFAGGFELLQTCDFVVAADDARLADQHANYGLFPGGGGTQRLPRLIGERRAKWLLLSGEPIDPAEAKVAGLVNEVCPADQLLERARAMAGTLAQKSPVGMGLLKRAVRMGLAAGDFGASMEVEQVLLLRHMASRDARIGLEAFASRCVPQFVGE